METCIPKNEIDYIMAEFGYSDENRGVYYLPEQPNGLRGQVNLEYNDYFHIVGYSFESLALLGSYVYNTGHVQIKTADDLRAIMRVFDYYKTVPILYNAG